MLASSRLDVLEETQRVEFGDGPALMFTEALMSLPFNSRDDFTDTVAALETAFYQVKDDTLDAYPDTEAVEELVAALDECDGDVERACSTATERLRRRWFVGESPWGDDDADCGMREIEFGSSLSVGKLSSASPLLNMFSTKIVVLLRSLTEVLSVSNIRLSKPARFGAKRALRFHDRHRDQCSTR